MKNERQEQTQAIAEIKERVQLTEWQRQIEERQTEGLGVEASFKKNSGISVSDDRAVTNMLDRTFHAIIAPFFRLLFGSHCFYALFRCKYLVYFKLSP